MKRAIHTLLSLLVTVCFISSCSNNYKEGDPGISSSDMFEQLRAMSIQSTGNGDTSLFNAMLDDTQTNVYFASAPSNMGPPQSLMSFVHFGIFNGNTEDASSPFDIETATVAFLDGFDNDGNHRFVLAVNYKMFDQSNTEGFVAEDKGAVFKDNSFEAIFETKMGRIVVRTFDLRDGVEDFTSFIQLKVYLLENGEEQYIGKFSTLAGFSGE